MLVATFSAVLLNALPISHLPRAAAPAEQPEAGCYGTERPSITCEAISAQAALDQARHSDAAFWLSVIACGVGAATLASAALAAKFARDAAIHTKRSADEAGASVIEARNSVKAAEESFEHARRLGIIQLRPYISLKVADLSFDNMGNSDEAHDIFVEYVVELTNVGSTPALGVKAGANILEIDWPLGHDAPPIDISAMPLTDFPTLPQGVPDRVTFTKYVKIDPVKQMAGTRRIALAVFVQYGSYMSADIYEIQRYFSITNFGVCLTSFRMMGPSTIKTNQETINRWDRTT